MQPLLVVTFCTTFPGHVITGGVISPTVTVAVVYEEQVFAVAVILNVVFCSVLGCVLVMVPAIGVLLPLLGIPVSMPVLSRVQV